METITQNETFRELTERLDNLRPLTRENVKSLWGQAIGYVWGWQDAGGAPVDSDVSWRFGLAYGWHAYRYATEMQGYRRNIRDAFQRWTSTGTIDD